MVSDGKAITLNLTKTNNMKFKIIKQGGKFRLRTAGIFRLLPYQRTFDTLIEAINDARDKATDIGTSKAITIEINE